MSDSYQYEVDETYGCWLWTGKLGGNGRPIIWKGRTPMNAYKALYELAHGPVSDDRVLDHLCRRPTSCVNPEHLEATSKQENERRKLLRYRLQRKQCKRGHALTEVSRVVTPEMGVLCRICMKEAM